MPQPSRTLPLPQVDGLRCFLAGAKTLNFRQASKHVALTPAAFGHRIRQLEDDIGADLFLRTTRSVQLTEVGLRLLPCAKKAVAALAECSVLATNGDFPKTELVIGSRHELGLSWIMPLIDPLLAKSPWLSVHMYFGSGTDLIARVRQGLLDCAITSTPIDDSRLEGLRLHQEDYAFVGSKTLLARSAFKTAVQAENFALIDVDDALPLYRYFREASNAPTLPNFAQVQRFGTIEAIRQRVLVGAGVAVLPYYLIKGDVAAGRLVRLFPKVKLLSDYFRLIIRKDDPRRTLFNPLVDFFRAHPLR
jgi:LysR family transcriptional regulator, glycine cleavage system transcriptional activator